MRLGIYKHLKTNNLYNVLKIGKLVDKPKQDYVIYEQLYKSKLRDEDTILPYGSVWIRELNDFKNKFVFKDDFIDNLENK